MILFQTGHHLLSSIVKISKQFDIKINRRILRRLYFGKNVFSKNRFFDSV